MHVSFLHDPLNHKAKAFICHAGGLQDKSQTVPGLLAPLDTAAPVPGHRHQGAHTDVITVTGTPRTPGTHRDETYRQRQTHPAGGSGSRNSVHAAQDPTQAQGVTVSVQSFCYCGGTV